MEPKKIGRPKTKTGPQEKLSLLVSTKAKQRLENMAASDKTSMTAVVEKLINQAYQKH